jgi:hypothetical protein
MTSDRALHPPPLGVVGSLAIYGFGAALLYFATRVLIPLTESRTGAEPVVAWFIAAGLGAFFPLILIAALLLRLERRSGSISWTRRLWCGSMSMLDWRYLLAGAGVIAVLSAPLFAAIVHVYGKRAFIPAFMTFDPLTSDRFCILAAWLPFFALNMLGEAFVWHGVMLPRQVESFGSFAWLISGLGWTLFHLALPWQIVVCLAPTMFVIPYLIQHRANVWVGVILHMFVNGPGFFAVGFGLA